MQVSPTTRTAPADHDPAAVAVVAASAAALAADEVAVVASITRLLRTIEGLDGDRRMVDLLEASIAGNVNTILHLLTRDIPIDRLQPTTAAVAYAGYLAERGTSVHALVRAYHMGQHALLELLHEQVRRQHCDGDLQLTAVQHAGSVLWRYIDWITRYLIEVYERERAAWEASGPSVHAALVLGVLAEQPGTPSALTAATGYDLAQEHVAVIAWGPSAARGGDLGVVADAVRGLARSTGVGRGRPPLVTAADRSTLYVWLPRGRDDTPLDTADVRELLDPTSGVHATVGLPAGRVEGFRESHAQAAAARRVALAAEVEPHVLGYDDPGVALVAGLTGDLDASRAWLADRLGGLAGDDESAARLRTTVATFLRTGRSQARTADELHLHRNSVRYRLEQAEELLGHPVDEAATDLAVALHALELLGRTALHRPDAPR